MANDKKQEMRPIEVRAAPCSRFRSTLAVLLWLGGIHFDAILVPIVLFFLPTPWAFMFLGLLLMLLLIPLYENSKIAQGVATFICKHAPSHFPITMVVEDMNAFDPDQAYLFATEPHSVLPIGIVALCNYTGYLPITKMKALATSAAFLVPVVRHVWSWLGLAPASMKPLLKYLKAGYSCILVPGGVREVLYMEHDREVVFLKRRYGFVRAAIQTGSPLVPTYIFGQTHVYHWYKPKGKLYEHLSRAIGFTPLAFWGMFGSPIPYPQPMYVAVGRPIEVQKNVEPSLEEVKELHGKFLFALQELFEKHKAASGYRDTHLYIY